MTDLGIPGDGEEAQYLFRCAVCGQTHRGTRPVEHCGRPMEKA